MNSSRFQARTSIERPRIKSQMRFGPCDGFERLSGVAFLLLGGGLLLLLCSSATAQYSIDWFTIDGGGGTSTNGQFALSGTIGQPDAGRISGGNYSLEGGFWGVITAVQTPGAPFLSLFRTATNTLVVSWPSPSTGFQLQQNTNGLATMNWSNITATVQDDGTNKSLIVNPPTGNRFYRLQNP